VWHCADKAAIEETQVINFVEVRRGKGTSGDGGRSPPKHEIKSDTDLKQAKQASKHTEANR
jgi:hypothetical protein